MTTVLQIIDRALEHIQIKAPGETTTADDADVGLRALTSLLDAAQLGPQNVIGLTELTFTPAAGAQTVTIGPTAVSPPDIIATMPVRLDPSSFYRINDVDELLPLCDSFEEYTERCSKTVQGHPGVCFYMRGDDTGTLYLWPAADGTTELHLWVQREVITGQTDLALADTLKLPPGYRMWLEYAVATELCPAFNRPPAITGYVGQRANQAQRMLKRANFVSHQLNTVGARDYDIRTGY
jgi:hypothetical protein